MKSKKSIKEELKGVGYYAIIDGSEVSLYDERAKHTRSNISYAATVTVKGNAYFLNGLKCKDAQAVRNAVDEYCSTLPYSPDTYNPYYNEEARLELRLCDYLEKCGLVSHANGIYEYEMSSGFAINGLYGTPSVKINVRFDRDNHKDNTSNGSVIRVIDNGKWVSEAFTNIEEAIAAVNSVLKGELLFTASNYVTVLKNLSDDVDFEGLEMTELKNGIIPVTTKMKDELITMLEKTLEKLKK